MEVTRTIGENEDKEQKRKERDVEDGLSQRKERVRRLDIARPQFSHYTQLTQPRFAILVAIERLGLIRLPKMVVWLIGKNQDEYC